jgi:hypothetical protein
MSSVSSQTPPVKAPITSQFSLASNADVLFFNRVLEKGSYLITGVVQVSAGANLNNVYVSALNGASPSKFALFAITSSAISQIFAPLTLCYFSDGITACNISVQVATAGAVVWSIGAGSLIQIQRLS